MRQLDSAIQQLAAASGDLVKAGRWYQACRQIIDPDAPVEASQVDGSLILRKGEVLLHGFGRAKGLLDAALEWSAPCIPQIAADDLADVRGALWRYVMAYSGWDVLAKSVIWDGKAVRSPIHPAFNILIDQATHFYPPHTSRSQAPEKLVEWLGADAGKEERGLPAFLGLNRRLKPFSHWLVGECPSFGDQQVLAAMRHIVAHGALSPSKAVQWQLQDLYRRGPEQLKLLTCRLLSELTALTS